MIVDIGIRGLGVIEHAELPLGPGFTALTGETGAGKTMVVTALGLLLGGRSSADAVRQGAAKAVVEGHWAIDEGGPIAQLTDDLGGDVDPLGDGTGRAELIVSRQVTAEGRSRAWLGGRAVPASALTDAGERLVVIHGQSDQLRLRGERAQREALDAFGGAEVRDALARVSSLWHERRRTRVELDELVAAEAQRVAEAERLRTAIADIEPAEPRAGEDGELLARIERLSNREALRRDVGAAHELLAGAGELGGEGDATRSAAATLRDVRGLLDRARASDATIETASTAAADALYAIDELALTLSGYLDALDLEGVGELEALDARLAILGDLKRKYGPTLDDVIGLYDRAGARLLELEGADDRIHDLEADVARLDGELADAAGELSELRRRAAGELSERVTGELALLAMPDARLHVAVEPVDDVSASGADRIAFLLRPHPGAAPTPISKGASGGELSRVMLALEVVLSDANPVPTLVFDEVDSGIGGQAAIEIGARLAKLAEHAQVIAVTHLAQVAAFATNHLRIEKSNDGEFTTSSIHRLDGDDRVAEVARLLSGLSESGTGHAHARELLELANERAGGGAGARSSSPGRAAAAGRGGARRGKGRKVDAPSLGGGADAPPA